VATQFLLGVAVVWILCGVVTGFVMRRKGHDFFVWLALGSVLGPLVFPLAINAIRQDSGIAVKTHDRAYPGTLDVIVGLDGSDEARQALRSATDTIQATSFTLVTVLDHDSRSSHSGLEMRQEAIEMLEEAARGLTHDDLRTEILFGRPDEALINFAEANDIELIVVGARGHGASEALFGSVARSLVGGSGVPVFVGSQPTQISHPQMRPD
jgi:nucleotide-binding universal stress UspA family protein